MAIAMVSWGIMVSGTIELDVASGVAKIYPAIDYLPYLSL